MSGPSRKPKDLLRQPYTRLLIPDEESGTFTAEILEFPGCVAQGESEGEALRRLNDAAESWISAATEMGQSIPRPAMECSFGGKFALRLPRGLHKQASLAAEREGTSLNQFIVAALSERLGATSLYERLVEKLESRFVYSVANSVVQTIEQFAVTKSANTATPLEENALLASVSSTEVN